MSLVKTPKAESFGEHQINSLFNIQIVELSAAKELVIAPTLRTCASRSFDLMVMTEQQVMRSQ